jgi:hypothetical protein
LFICAKEGHFLDDKRGKKRFDYFKDKVAKRPEAKANQLILSIWKELFCPLSNCLSDRKCKIDCSKRLVIWNKYKVVNVAFGIVLDEEVQHIGWIINILIHVTYDIGKDFIWSKEQNNSALFIPSDYLVELDNYTLTFKEL